MYRKGVKVTALGHCRHSYSAGNDSPGALTGSTLENQPIPLHSLRHQKKHQCFAIHSTKTHSLNPSFGTTPYLHLMHAKARFNPFLAK